MPDRLARTAAWAIPVGGGLLFVALWLEHAGFWLDDAFITFRYARNLAEGVGPVFNPGEPVEGYTTFLWMLVSAFPFALLDGSAALRVIELSGAALGLFVLWRCWTFPAPAPDGTSPSRWLVLLLAANPIFVANCGDGMETPLFMALLIECARAFVREPSGRAGAVTGALVAACILTRPEALPLLVVLPALLLSLRPGTTRRWLGGFGAASLPPLLAHLAWRWSFYGSPLPNTFYAKATGELGARLAAGTSDLGDFAVGLAGIPAVGLWFAVALALLGLRAAARPNATPATRVWLAGLWTLVVFRVAFDLWSGSEYMGAFRFLAPALPPLFVLADEGVHELRAVAFRKVGLLVAAVALATGTLGSHALAKSRGAYRLGLENAHIALGLWLAENLPPNTWAAIGDAGAVPFFSRLPIIDLWGLSDATIARLPGEYGRREGVAEYVLGRRPGVIILWNVVPIQAEPDRLRIMGAQAFDREIAAHPLFREQYRFLREFTFRATTTPGTGYYLDVFEHRPDRVPRQSDGRGS